MLGYNNKNSLLFIKEVIKNNKIKVFYIKLKNNIINFFIKPLFNNRFNFLEN